MHATIQSTTKRAEKVDSQGDDLSGLIEDLDTVFSKYVRLKGADENGFVQCFTCDAMPIVWTQTQCGHFIPRSHLATRWEEANCRPQCRCCNELKSGNLGAFKDRLEDEHPGITEWVSEQSRQISKLARSELKHLLLMYRAKLKLAEKKLK